VHQNLPGRDRQILQALGSGADFTWCGHRLSKCIQWHDAMQKIQQWSAAFDYTDLDRVIDQMKACNAFEKSLKQYQLLNLSDLGTVSSLLR